MPGKLHAELPEYSGKPRQQNLVQAALQPNQHPSITFREELTRVQLATTDGTRLVGIGLNVLSIHMLRPYGGRSDGSHDGGWNEFFPRIRSALRAYWTVASPKGVTRIGIRYINSIKIPHHQNKIRVEEYFHCAPRDVEGLPDDMMKFASRTEYRYGDGIRLVLNHATLDTSPQDLHFLLDLDVIWAGTEALTEKSALQTSELLHARENEAFESLITDRLREVFDAEQ